MSLYSDAPEPLAWGHVKPTILVCWWATLFSTLIILLRVAGRMVRSEQLFTEDRMAFFCLIPLYVRMALVHVILLYGTNNDDFSRMSLTQEEIRRRTIGSGLVLASRIFYSATLWMLKNTVLEFFKRLSGLTWSRAYQNSFLVARCILIATFIAVFISDLAECQPFAKYWQVLPDPGGSCRQGYANLLTNGVCNVLTDLLLVILPVPIIVSSQMAFTRKIQLVLLFSMSLLVVLVTLYRLPSVIEAHGSQQLRSLLASIELLVATGVANALVLGSFVRDRGTKKRRFKYGSSAGESVHGSDSIIRSRRPTAAERAWGSDDDLFRDVGFIVSRDSRHGLDDLEAPAIPARPRPAGPVAPLKTFNMQNWNFPDASATADERRELPTDHTSDPPNSSGPKKVAFFDVGGLLADEGSGPSTGRRRSTLSSLRPASPPTALPAGANGFRRGSQAILQDLGGLLGPFRSSSRGRVRRENSGGSSGTELRELSPAISPKTEVPPRTPEKSRHHSEPERLRGAGEGGGSTEPPPYEEAGRRRCESVIESESPGGTTSRGNAERRDLE